MNDAAGNFRGLDRFEARERIVAALQDSGYLEKVEPHKHAVGHCSRCNSVIEPYLSWQWFVKMAPLAAPAIEAVKKGKLKLFPGRWKKVYLNWMENIRDWCISRQLWWGHGSGVVSGATETVVSIDPPAGTAGSRRGCARHVVLVVAWPFATLGWPSRRRFWRATPEQPTWSRAATSLLLDCAHDHGRLSLHGQAPFAHVYFTSIVRDAQGRKISSRSATARPLAMMEVRRGRTFAWCRRPRARTCCSTRSGSRPASSSRTSCGTPPSS